jgi:hypothetical protein
MHKPSGVKPDTTKALLGYRVGVIPGVHPERLWREAYPTFVEVAIHRSPRQEGWRQAHPYDSPIVAIGAQLACPVQPCCTGACARAVNLPLRRTAGGDLSACLFLNADRRSKDKQASLDATRVS